MANLRFTNNLSTEYQRLYDSCEIRPNRFKEIDKIIDDILRNRKRYESVADTLGIPWYFIAAVHNLESSRRFTRHLHNGEPLTARTRQVPAGRPKRGKPPFTWEESAVDALNFRKLHRIKDWSLTRFLYELEGYNGWGYRSYHPEVLSPYLWGFSNHYRRGKYVADGRWSNTAVSSQCGGGSLIRRLEERQIIDVDKKTRQKTPYLHHSSRKIQRADDLQRFLNTFPEIHLRVDSNPGNKTSEAFKKVFGFYLDGDPRPKKIRHKQGK